MSTVRRQILLNVFKIFDLAMMVFSFLLATIAVSERAHSGGPAQYLSMRIKVSNFAILLLLLFLWHLILCAFGLYASRRLSRQLKEQVDIFKATCAGVLLVGFAGYFFHIHLVTRLFLVCFWLAVTLSMLVSRLLLRATLARTRLRGRNLRDMLIVGTNPRALEFFRNIRSRPELGYRVIGFADEPWPGLAQFSAAGQPLVCDLAGVPEFLRHSVVDEVIISLPIRSYHDHASRIAAACEEQGIVFRVLSNIFNLKLAHSRAEEFEGSSLITHYTGGIAEGYPQFVKRVIDFCVALVAIALLSPLFLVAAVLIKLTSKGPVFFAQKRVGLNKRTFAIYKFRTMVVDAEKKLREIEHLNEVTGPVFKITRDPRITWIGRFLRHTSIDELPQLFNVLKGHMSLVGPRPLPVRDYEGFSEDWHRRRFSVRPGITCLWQIAGRSAIPFEKWMEMDLQYIDKWSLWLDFQILLRTIPAVIRGSGAA